MEDNAQMPSYWPSVIVGALFVSILTSIIATIYLYYLAGSEPTISLVMKSSLLLPITCLFGLVGGIISTRHYATTHEITFAIGKGATIGFLTGVVAAAINAVIGQVWMFIDPALLDNFANNMVAALSQMEMPAAQREEALARMTENFERQKSLSGILMGTGINMLVLGVVNLITGIIGAKIYAKEEES
jgi:hypothetical protein